jgi:hypothetical protein
MMNEQSTTPAGASPSAGGLTSERGGRPSAKDLLSQIRGVKRRAPREVDMRRFAADGWPDRVWIRGASAAAKDEWEGERYQVGKKGRLDMHFENVKAGLVARCLCDHGGALLFPDVQEGKKTLGAMDSPPIEYLYDVAKEESGISAGDEEEMERAEAELEDELGNDRSDG